MSKQAGDKIKVTRMHRIRCVSFGCLDGHWSYVATVSCCFGQRMASNGHRSGRSVRGSSDSGEAVHGSVQDDGKKNPGVLHPERC